MNFDNFTFLNIEGENNTDPIQSIKNNSFLKLHQNSLIIFI